MMPSGGTKILEFMVEINLWVFWKIFAIISVLEITSKSFISNPYNHISRKICLNLVPKCI